MRIEFPPGLSPEEERAVVAALEAYLASSRVRPAPWALVGRAENLRLGALQIRHQALRPWRETGMNPYTRRGTENLRGRGDAR